MILAHDIFLYDKCIEGILKYKMMVYYLGNPLILFTRVEDHELEI